jgi:FkbM family methyltransferase
LFKVNALKNNYIYKYHYFDKNIIQKGDVVLDIGGNLGYYTKLFAKWVGDTGHVYAVEPVSLFADTIKWGTKNFSNITIYNFALGEEEKDITLSTPGNFGYLRTGLASVDTGDKQFAESEFTFKAKMKRASHLFKEIPKIDFIKMDIEGYEYIVLPEMKDILVKHKPLLQVETWGEQKFTVENFLAELGYEIYDLEEGVLKPVAEIKNWIQGDLIFIHKDNNSVLDRLRKIKAAK